MTLLHKEVQDSDIQALKVCRGVLGISHLLFADDRLLFFKAVEDQAARVMSVLDTYASCTSQLINPGKCSILFSEHGDVQVQNIVKKILQVALVTFEAKYLALPTPRETVDGLE